MGDLVIRFYERFFDWVADAIEAYMGWCLDGATWRWLIGFILPIVLVWVVFILSIVWRSQP